MNLSGQNHLIIHTMKSSRSSPFLPFLFLLLLISFWSFAGEITITGSGYGNNSYPPIASYYKYSYSEQIYLQTELSPGAQICIDSIAFDYQGTAWTDPVVVYMGHTSKSTFSSSSDWVTSGSQRDVFSGSYTVSTNGWYAIELNTGFVYNNSDNLIISVDKNSTVYRGSSDYFWCTDPSANRSLRYYSDATNPSPSSPPTGYLLSRRPRFWIHYQDIQTKPVARGGDCMVFDGTSDYVRIPDYIITGSTWTVEFWIKPNSIDDADRIFLQGSGAHSSRQIMAVWDNVDDQIEFKTSTTGTSGTADVASSTITDDGSTWTHVAWTSNNNVYVNGVSSTGSVGSSNYGIGGGTYVGCREGTQNYFNGSLDEVRIWNDVRTQTEIQDYMNATIDSSTSAANNLMLYYRFDEGSGGYTYDHSDVSQNGYITGATYATSGIWNTITTDDDSSVTFWAGYDPNGDAITFSQTVAPTNGTLIYDNANAEITYVPDINSSGADNFTFQISDGSETDTYAMSVTTTNVNMPPVAGSGNCLSFDGVNECILLPDGDMVNATWTLELWVKPNSPDNTERVFLLGAGATTNRQIMGVWYNDHLEFYTSSTGASGTPQIATSAITDNNSTWTHVAWTYNGSTHTVYVNGQSSSGTVVGGNVGVSGSSYIGTWNESSGKFWTGSLDEIRLWDDVRTQSEIQDNRYTALVGNEANLVGYWRFDESEGVTTYDYAGKDDHGKLLNMEDGDFVNCNTWKYRTMQTSSSMSHSVGFDPDGDAITITEVGGPTTGLSFDSLNRECDYTSGATPGTVTYTYQVDDGSLTDNYAMEIEVEGEENYNDWNYSQILYLNTTASGANVSSDVLNFPLCVRLDTTNFRFGQAESDGADMRFAKSDGTHLTYEREQWSLSASDSFAVFWVLLDTVYGNNSSQFIKMYWGKSGASDASSPSNVFKTTSGYDFVAVHHLTDNGPFSDATSNNNNGTNYGSANATSFNGECRDFTGTDPDSIRISGLLGSNASLTLSAWIRSDVVGTSGSDVISIADAVVLRVDEGGTNTKAFYRYAGGGFGTVSTNEVLSGTGRWYYIVYVCDPAGATQKVYINGVEEGSDNNSNAIDYASSGSNTIIGGHGWGNTAYDFDGLIDEARISSVGRSADWIKLNYENQRLAQSLVEYEVYSNWNYSTSFTINTTSSGADITSDITDFPLLIRLDTTNFSFSDAETNGEDIRFTMSNGKHLYHEIERWDNTNKVAEIWVRVDSIYGNNASQYIKMYYGKSAVLNTSRGDRVFDVSEGFAGTWHLKASDYSDVTWNGNNGTNNGAADVDGVIGKGKDFEGEGVGDYVNVPYAAELAPVKEVTLNLWAYDSDWTTTWDSTAESFVSKIEGGGWELRRSTTLIQARVYRNSVRADVNYTHGGLSSGWHYFTCIYDGRYTKLYVDGDSVNANDAGADYDMSYVNNNSLIIGGDPDATVNPETYYQGYLDEIRVSSEARSADWIKLCYMNQKADQTVVTADAVELLPLTVHHNIGSVRQGPSDTLEIITDQWKIIFDEDIGGGVKWLSNEATGSGVNQLNNNLFYINAAGTNSYAVTGALTLIDSSSLFCQVSQRVVLSSQPWDIEYTVYGNGRMYVRVTTEALWSAYDPAGGIGFYVNSDITNRGYYTQSATANAADYMLHADKASSRYDILFALFEDWSQADGFTSTSANDYLGITDADWQLAANSKQVWEFLIDFGHKKWNDTTGIGKHVDDYRDIDSLEYSYGRYRMDKAWEERLIGHWTFDEGTAGSADGATVGDSSGTGHTGTIEGGTWSDGQWRNGVLFDGNDSVALTNYSDYDKPFVFTITAWIKKSGIGETDDMIFGKFNPTAGEGYKFFCDSDKLKITTYDNTLTSATSLGTGWRHVAVTCNMHGGYTKLFVDGIPDKVWVGQPVITASSVRASIGNSFNGTLDDVRFYNKEISEGTIRAMAQTNYRVGNGMYMVRSDNNNTVDLTIDGTGSQPEYFPIFQIANYWATSTPKAVYYDGAWLSTPKGYIATLDDINNVCTIGFNKRVPKSDLRIYIDDNDSTGAFFIGPMPTLTYGASGSDYYVQNTSSSTFGPVGSNEFYLFWKMSNSTGFGGELWRFKSSESEPSEAIASADNMIDTSTNFTFGYHDHIDASSNYASSATEASSSASYTVLESSDMRIRLQIDERTIDDTTGLNYDITTIWTIYPTGQIFRYDTVDNLTATIDYEFVRFRMGYEEGTSQSKSDVKYSAVVYNTTNAHDHVLALLDGEDKNGNQLFTGAASGDTLDWQDDASTYMGYRFLGGTDRANTDAPLKYAFYIDIRHQNMDASYRDSVVDPLRTIASHTLNTGSWVTTEEGDLDNDGFCEAEGAYVISAVDNRVDIDLEADGATDGCLFYPAFRITGYTANNKPRYVKLYTASDTITLLEDYTYNSYLNDAANELVMQLDTVLCSDVSLFIDYDDDLAVTMSNFYAIPGDGNDTLFWKTESESKNLGFFLYRRIAPRFYDSLRSVTDTTRPESKLEEAGVLLKRGMLPVTDTLWVPVNKEIIPGAEGGTSVGPLEYSTIDFGVHNNVLYEYKLEMVDMGNKRGEYGPISVMPVPMFPKQFMLFHNFPNPVKYYTFIKFDLPEKTPVSLNIYNLQGRLVTQLIKPGKPMNPGYYKVRWDARNEYGRPLASGPYIYRLVAGKRYAKSRLMILVK